MANAIRGSSPTVKEGSFCSRALLNSRPDCEQHTITALLSTNFIERLCQTCNSLCKDLDLATEADTEVLRSLEKSPRNHRRIVFLPQQITQPVNAVVLEPRERDGAEIKGDGVKIFTPGHEVSEATTVGLQHRTRARANVIEVCERNATHEFGRMRYVIRNQIIEAPDLLCQLGLSQDPATAQPAQPIYFCQTVRDQKFRTEMESRRRRAFEKRVHVNLADQHAGPRFARDCAHLPEAVLIEERAAGIVQIRKNDQARSRGDRRLEFVR